MYRRVCDMGERRAGQLPYQRHLDSVVIRPEMLGRGAGLPVGKHKNVVDHLGIRVREMKDLVKLLERAT